MRQTIEYSKMAFRNIIGNKMRSLLTMLGIIIGIAAVIIVLCIGAGGQKSIQDQLSSFVTPAADIYVWGDDSTYADYISEEDIRAINEMPEVAAATMVENYGATVRGTREDVSSQIEAGTAAMNITKPSTLAYGRKWDEGDYNSQRRVCTVDSNGAKELFGSDNVAGMPVSMTINGRTAEFTIVGVIKSNAPPMSKNVTPKFTMPISSLYSVLGYAPSSYYRISVLSHDANNSYGVAMQAIGRLELRHNNAGREMYVAQDMSMMMGQTNEIIGLFTTIITAIAGISLLVGGIGVMNIMLVSVTERTREIGVRKALGAKTGTILFQFLIESATLTFLGGVIGIILGVWGGSALGSIMGIEASIEIPVVILIALFSSAIGIFFGIYPARKAARLNPIEALRSE